MTIINVSYNVPHPKFTDPEGWLKKIKHSTGILESMAKENRHKVIAIYNISFNGVIKKNKVEYHFPNFHYLQLLFPFNYNNYVKRLNPTVVIVHGMRSPWQVILLRWQLGKKIMIILQNHAERPYSDLRKYFQRWADCYIDAYLFTSMQQGEVWAKSKLIRHADKIGEVMEASSDFNIIDKEEALTLTQVKRGKIYLWVGGLDENKDPLLMMKAFSQFAKNNSGSYLYMIYQSVELLNDVEEWLSKNLWTKEIIHLIGKIDHDQLLYWYNSSDFIVSTSHYEGSGIAVCEAMSCGCIPVLSDIPSFTMMSDKGSVGILFESENSNSLVQALVKSQSLDLKEEKRKVLKQFNDKLSFEAIAKKIMEIIHAGLKFVTTDG